MQGPKIKLSADCQNCQFYIQKKRGCGFDSYCDKLHLLLEEENFYKSGSYHLKVIPNLNCPFLKKKEIEFLIKSLNLSVENILYIAGYKDFKIKEKELEVILKSNISKNKIDNLEEILYEYNLIQISSENEILKIKFVKKEL